MSGKASSETLQQEFDLAYSLVYQASGINFKKPTLCIGDRHRSKFFEFGSMKDMARYGLLQMIYDDQTNSIFVPDHLLTSPFIHLPNYARDNRVFAFRHELVHALSSQLNPKKDALIHSGKKEHGETEYVLIAFDEGLANYLAIASAYFSNDQNLRAKAEEERLKLVNAFTEWTGDGFNMKVLAKLYNKRPEDILEILLAYFRKTPAMLELYKYIIGYRFVQGVNPQKRDLTALIKNPPVHISQLIYPATYRMPKTKS